MQGEISESVFHATTPAEVKDMYYSGEHNTEIQAFPTTVESRFRTDLPSLAFGSTSTVIYNPQEGLQDIILTATLPAPVGNLYQNWALSRGWLSQMIRQVGLRIGGSSLYYWTADQLEIVTFEECEDHVKKDAYWSIAGAEVLSQAGFATESARTASVYIKLPFNTISALQKTLPLPTDLLTQPMQILIEFNRAEDVFFALAGASVANLPSAFASAQVQFKAVHLQDSSKLLARREDMNVKALMHPLRSFDQTTFRTTVQATAGQEVQLNLTGFRSGSVKDIKMWALKVADGAGVPTNVAGNNRNYSQILDCRLSVNGLVYYDTRSASSNLWNLCDLKTPAYVEQTILTDGGAGVAVATPSVASWVHIPLAQVVQPEANESDVALGLPIANSVVNVSLKLPETGRYIISASYGYACSLMFSKGSCEYVF